MAKNAIIGFESIAYEFRQKNLSLDDFLLPQKGDSFLSKMESDSLKSIGIYLHDILIVQAGLDPVDKDVVVYVLDGQTDYGVFNRTEQYIENDLVKVTITEENDFLILGVVANSIRCFRPISIL